MALVAAGAPGKTMARNKSCFEDPSLLRVSQQPILSGVCPRLFFAGLKAKRIFAAQIWNLRCNNEKTDCATPLNGCQSLNRSATAFAIASALPPPPPSIYRNDSVRRTSVKRTGPLWEQRTVAHGSVCLCVRANQKRFRYFFTNK